jgi:plastocyanin
MLLRSLALATSGVLLCAVPASAATYTVAVRDDYFGPRLVTVRKGDRVTWVNRGNSDHTVTTRRWNVVLSPGETYSRRIYRAWRYHCVYHSDMTARIACRNCG